MNRAAASAIRRGIYLGRLMAVEAALTRFEGVPYEGWRHVRARPGIYRRAFWRAVDHGADAEIRRISVES